MTPIEPSSASPDPAAAPRARRRVVSGLVLVTAAILVGGYFFVSLWVATSAAIHPALIGLAFCSVVIAALALRAALGAAQQIRGLREETRRHEQINHTSLTRLRALWEQAPLSIMLFEPNDPTVPVKIVDCNPVAC